MVPLRPAAGLARGGTSRLEDTLELKIFEGEECLVGDGSAENQSGKSLQKAPLGNRLCQFGGTIHEINYPKQHCLVSFISLVSLRYSVVNISSVESLPPEESTPEINQIVSNALLASSEKEKIQVASEILSPKA